MRLSPAISSGKPASAGGRVQPFSIFETSGQGLRKNRLNAASVSALT